MEQARKVFETMMKANGYSEEFLIKKNDRYTNPVVQTRWKYFRMGWEMKGLL